jgi:hypothetical protein
LDGDIERWIRDIESRSEATNLPLHPQFLRWLSEKHLGVQIYEHMRNLFHIVLSISPLLVLQPRKFNHETHARHNLIAVSLGNLFMPSGADVPLCQTSFALGNKRPPYLAAAERLLWTTFMQISLGSSAMEELVSFMRAFKELRSRYKDSWNELDWFDVDRK